MYAAIPVHIYIISSSQLWLRGATRTCYIGGSGGITLYWLKIHVATEPDFFDPPYRNGYRKCLDAEALLYDRGLRAVDKKVRVILQSCKSR